MISKIFKYKKLSCAPFIVLLLFSMLINNSCVSGKKKNIGIPVDDVAAFHILSEAHTLFMNDIVQTTSFFILFENENAVDLFVQLLKESKTGAGRFIALLGLFECDKELYEEMLNLIDPFEEFYVQTIRSSSVIFSTTFDEWKITIKNGVWLENLNDSRRRNRSEQKQFS